MSYIPPIITGSLPIPLAGPHAVGYATLRHAPSNPYTLPSPRLPSVEGKQGVPALGVRQVEYSIYYPCERPNKGWFWQRDKQGSGVSWLPRPIDVILDGYRRFANDHPLMKAAAPILKFTGGRLSMPVLPLAPLLPLPTDTLGKPIGQRKLVIFSHGLAGTKNAYSSVCAALASEGNVVLAVAHGDGSGPGVVIHEEGGDQIKLQYLKYQELDWKPERTPDVMHLRTLQLNVRVSELYETFSSFSKFVESGSAALGPTFDLDTQDGPPPATKTTGQDAKSAWIDSWKGSVDLQSLCLCGHSFGGGTLLHLLSNPAPKGFGRMPVRKAVALDPWVDPLPMPAATKDMQEDTPRIPLLAINSEGFTLWSTHFRRLSGFINKAGGSLVSIIGCDHQSFSDFPLLVTAPSATKLIVKFNSLVNSFMHDELATNPEIVGKVPDRGHLKTKTNEKGRQKLDGVWGDVVVHELSAS